MFLFYLLSPDGAVALCQQMHCYDIYMNEGGEAETANDASMMGL